MQAARLVRAGSRRARPRRGRAPRARGGRARACALRREQPDAGALLLRVLGQDELRAAGELELERRRLRPGLAGAQVALEPARGHQVDEEHELAVGGREEEPLRAALGPAELAALERGERRVERLQRRDVRGAGLRDRERGDRVRQLSAPRLHLRELGHRAYHGTDRRAAASRAGRATRRPRSQRRRRASYAGRSLDASTPPSSAAERDHAPDDPAPRRVHAPEDALGDERLVEADPRDVEEDDAERRERERSDERTRSRGRAGRGARGAIGAPPSAPPTAIVRPMPMTLRHAPRDDGADEPADVPEHEHEPELRRREPCRRTA